MKRTVAGGFELAVDHRLSQVPLQAARQLTVQRLADHRGWVTTSGSLHLGPATHSLVNGLRSTTRRLPGKGHELNALLLARLEVLQELAVVGLLCHYPSLFHRNF